MNALTKTTAAYPQPVYDRQVSTDLAATKSRLSRDYPSAPEILGAPLPVPTRSRLETRRRQLEVWLAPASRGDHAQIARAVAEMLGSLNGSGQGSVQATVAKYLEILSDLPTWASIAACRSLERGEVVGASLDLRPGAARVRDTARKLMAPWLEELFELRRVLEAPALEPEAAPMREKLGRLLTDFVADMRAGKYSQKLGG